MVAPIVSKAVLASLGFLLAQSASLAGEAAARPSDEGVRVNVAANPKGFEPTVHPDLRVDVPLVLIPVHVTTKLGSPVTDLKQENFHLFEDSIEQSLSYFASEDAPLSVGIVFDTSGSMQPKMRKACEAATEFFRTSNPEDEFFLIEFGTRPWFTVPFTQESDQVYWRLRRAQPWGPTSLLDAIYLALSKMKGAHNSRKAILIISDGGDNHSRHKEREVINAMRESDAQVYAIGIYDAEEPPKRAPELRKGPQLLDELAEETGGRHFPIEDVNDLPAVCRRISLELRNQYLLGYSAAYESRDGKYHRVKVSVTPPANEPPFRTSYRHGYYAPNQ